MKETQTLGKGGSIVPYRRTSFVICFSFEEKSKHPTQQKLKNGCLSLHTCCMWKQLLAGRVTEAEAGNHHPLPPQVGGDGPNCSGTSLGCMKEAIDTSIHQSVNKI